MNRQEQWVQEILLRDLGPVEAPAELWDRVQGGPVAKAREAHSWRPGRPMVWVLAVALVVVVAVLAVRAHGPAAVGGVAEAGTPVFQSGDPAQLRAWINQHAGIDVALPGVLQPSVRLIGASVVHGGEPAVQVVYRVGDREATLLVAKTRHPAGSGAGGVRHADLRAEPSSNESNSGGKITWVMHGQMYTLACFGPGGQEDARVACLLCHA